VYSCPGPAFFCLPIDTAPTWHLLPPPVAFRFGFVLLSHRSALGLLAGTRLVVWDGFFLPLLGATVRTRTRRTPCCLRFTWFAPSCDFGILSPTLWFTLPAFGASVSFPALLASRWALDFLWPPRGMPETLNFMPSTLALGLILVWCAAARWDWFDPRSGGGACSHCNCVFLLPDRVLLPGWVSLVGEGTRGGFQAAGVIIFLACVG